MTSTTQTASPLAVYDPVRAELARIKAQSASLVFIYADPAGNKAARSHVFSLRKLKGEAKRLHDQAKAEFLIVGRKIDGALNEIEAEVDQMIEVHAKPLRDIEEAARLAKEEEERAAQAEKDRLAKEEKDRQEAAFEAVRQENLRIQAELSETKRQQERDRRDREIADQAREQERENTRKAEDARLKAEQDKLDAERREIEAQKKAEADRLAALEKARADQEAAVEQARVEMQRQADEKAAEQLRADEEAKAVEAERLKSAGVRVVLIREIADSLQEFVEISDLLACNIAAAILDGQIARVRAVTEG